MKIKWISLVLVVLGLLWPAGSALADGPAVEFDEGRIFVDEDVSLEPGETFDGDLAVFNGDVLVPEDSAVDGDLFVTGGSVLLAGQVNGSVAVLHGGLDLAEPGLVRGDLFAMGGEHKMAGQVRGDMSILFGDVTLRSTAVVDGDLLVEPGAITREAGAQVRGDEVHDLRIPWGSSDGSPTIEEPVATPPLPEEEGVVPPPAAPPVPSVPPAETFGERFGRFVGRVMVTLLASLAFLAVSALVVLAWPRQTRRVSDCIAAAPAQSFGLGLLTFLMAIVLEALAVVMMIVVILVGALLMGTVILIPLGLLLILLSVLVLLPVPLALIAGVVLGWVGLAEWLGAKVLRWAKVEEPKALGAVVVGLLLTVPVASVLWVVKPVCCAWPFVILLTSVGVGAVFHTRFGTQSCRPEAPSAAPPPPSGEPAAPAGELLPAEAMDAEAGRPDTGNP